MAAACRAAGDERAGITAFRLVAGVPEHEPSWCPMKSIQWLDSEGAGMAIIAERDRQTITQMFDENLEEPVRLVYFTIPKSLIYVPGRLDCETCDDVQKLMEE